MTLASAKARTGMQNALNGLPFRGADYRKKAEKEKKRPGESLKKGWRTLFI